jgi:hypothetical protein
MAYLLDLALFLCTKECQNPAFMTTYVTGFVVEIGTINRGGKDGGMNPKTL